MGKFDFTASRVRQLALNQKASGKTSKLPAWVDVLGDIPPSQVVVRNQPPQHQLIRQRLRKDSEDSKPRVVYEAQEKRIKPKKASRVFQPMPIRFEEDQLRKEFFSDHPWELARPRILVEKAGKDFEHHDWSRIQQPGKKLDGESVVQRQLWLLQNEPNMTKGAAYDIARREFYRLRLREDIERRVAAEEAQAFGADFGPSRLEIGMQLENEEFERWKKWARIEAQAQLNQDVTAGAAQSAAAEADSAPESAIEESAGES
ncbi:hypothetical protein PHISP_01303 [Aspergillus sp. HF37]|nr:hypothetical protein PHISP_01303 [Aspergillus sp. HF37]